MPQFTQPKAGVGPGNIEYAVILIVGGFQKALKFVVREGTAFLLSTSDLDFPHLIQRIVGNAALLAHPIQEAGHGVEIIVQSLWRISLAASTPLDERVRRNISEIAPAGFLE
ncbi:MAG: hypothetical protein ACFB21_16350 [Opitutales bacterium]